METKDVIYNYIVNKLLEEKSQGDLAFDDDLLTPDMLDSVAIVELITFLEQSFQIEIDVGEITEENIGSVSQIVGFVESKRGSGTPTAKA